MKNSNKKHQNLSQPRSCSRTTRSAERDQIEASDEGERLVASIHELIKEFKGQNFESEESAFAMIIERISERFSQGIAAREEVREILRELLDSDPALRADILSGLDVALRPTNK